MLGNTGSGFHSAAKNASGFLQLVSNVSPLLGPQGEAFLQSLSNEVFLCHCYRTC